MGLLGKASLAATTYTVVATNGASVGTVNIRVVNRDLVNQIALTLAICPSSYTSGAPAAADFIEPPALLIPAGGVLEETGMVIDPGEKIVAYASAASVTVRVFGL